MRDVSPTGKEPARPDKAPQPKNRGRPWRYPGRLALTGEAVCGVARGGPAYGGVSFHRIMVVILSPAHGGSP